MSGSRLFSTAIAFFVGMAISASSASAQPRDADEGRDWVLSHVFSFIQPGEKVDSLKQRARSLFTSSDLDGGGVSRSDYELAEQIQAANQRGNQVGRWAQLDLDGDGKVTRVEVERAKTSQAFQSLRPHGITIAPTPEQVAAVLKRLVREAMIHDVDGDGVITLAEVLEADAKRQAEQNRRATGRRMVPLALDRNSDGIVSLEEFETTVAEVIALIDTDANGIVSQVELETARTMVRAAQKAQAERLQQVQQARVGEVKAKACSFPKPRANAKVILVGAYEGGALSNVGIGSQDEETTVAQIAIEPGSEPLYVVAVSYESMVWQVTGANERVASFVATSKHHATDKRPRVGVTGIVKERVFIAPQYDCVHYFSDTRQAEGERAKGELTGLIGRAPDDVIGTYRLSRVALPSGIVSPQSPYPNVLNIPAAGAGAVMWKEFLHWNRGGIAANDPASVVAALPVRHYEVLPRQAGLAQLLDEGALQVASQIQVIDAGGARVYGTPGRIVGLPADAVFHMLPNELRIVKKMRFPAGLTGAHSVTFVLGRGVPMPDGEPGHSKVISEETGQVLKGRR